MARRGTKRNKPLKDVPRTLGSALIGSSFVHPFFDYFLIGGVLSLIFTAIVVGSRNRFDFVDLQGLSYIILLSNSAHFAASTVRLYTKPGAFESLPFLTMAFPLLAAGILTMCMLFPASMGPHLQSLYLTWSPYHYAAQAYGLAVMYSYRSGCMLGATNKRLLWWVSMLAFFYAFAKGNRTGLEWLLPSSAYDIALVSQSIDYLADTLWVLAYVAPLLLYLKVWHGKEGPMPLISLLMIVTNSIWWIMLPTLDAFVWATIFHGIQYLAIVIIFHVRDQVPREENRHGTFYHVVWFYAACILLGYGIFQCLPRAYEFAGFGMVESNLLVVAAINIHHFIVDAYIWRLKRGDGNRQIVVSGQPAAA